MFSSYLNQNWMAVFHMVSFPLIYVWEDIPAKILSHDFPSTESFFVEIILHKKKWRINCSYDPNKNNIKNHLDTISKALDAFSTK